MDVAILTVGDELLAGDIENTNATWLAGQLAERGASARRILVVPDDRGVIAEYVRDWSASFDAVLVTGGLGGTHDDVTMDAVAEAFDRDLVAEEAVVEHVLRTMAEYRDRNPETVERHDVDLDVEEWAATPEGSRPLLNENGLCPGCVVGNVYVFPGVPEEMRPMFESVAAEFAGDAVSETIYTGAPEAALQDDVDAARERFDVAVGSYPDRSGPNRIKVTGTDSTEVRAAIEWLDERVADP